MGFKWETESPDKMFSEGVIRYSNAIKQGLYELALSLAPRIEADMKASAVWTDRTGNARQALHTDVETLINEVVIWLSHGVEYGVFLELSNAGRYAIIGSSLDKWSQEVWRAVKALMS